MCATRHSGRDGAGTEFFFRDSDVKHFQLSFLYSLRFSQNSMQWISLWIRRTSSCPIWRRVWYYLDLVIIITNLITRVLAKNWYNLRVLWNLYGFFGCCDSEYLISILLLLHCGFHIEDIYTRLAGISIDISDKNFWLFLWCVGGWSNKFYFLTS